CPAMAVAEEGAAESLSQTRGERVLCLEHAEELGPAALDRLGRDALVEERILEQERAETPRGRGEVDGDHRGRGVALDAGAPADRRELRAGLLDRGESGGGREPRLGVQLPRAAGVEHDREADGDGVGFPENRGPGLGVGRGGRAEAEGRAECECADGAGGEPEEGAARGAIAPVHGPTSTMEGDARTRPRSAASARASSTPTTA